MNEYYAMCRYTKQGSLVKLDSSSKCLFHCLILKANIEKCILEINFLDTFWIISSSKAARTYPEMQMLGNQNVLTCDYYRRLKIVLTEYTNSPPQKIESEITLKMLVRNLQLESASQNIFIHFLWRGKNHARRLTAFPRFASDSNNQYYFVCWDKQYFFLFKQINLFRPSLW